MATEIGLCISWHFVEQDFLYQLGSRMSEASKSLHRSATEQHNLCSLQRKVTFTTDILA